MKTDTIAAISTAHGKGGIAVIRISGGDALAVAERIFTPKKGGRLGDRPPRTAVYGDIKDNTAHGCANDNMPQTANTAALGGICEDNTAGGCVVLDDGIAVYYPAPHSYTGEDTVELSCHGGMLLTRKVLEAALSAGARPAEAGEFTRRAFTAGRLTLSQAEAVINKIDARTGAQLSLASSHAKGVLSDKIASLCGSLAELAAGVYVTIDFPDEDLSPVSCEELLGRAAALGRELAALAATYRAGSAVAEGIYCVIAGKPNTGKSSLLNMLLGRERAIVTGTAGTTRDTIEEYLQLGEVTLRLCDTAGIRVSSDELESIGIERAKERISQAGLLLAVFDGSAPLDDSDYEVLRLCDETKCAKIAVVNKSDLGTCIDIAELRSRFGEAVCISASRGEGRAELAAVVDRLFETGGIDYDTTAVIATARQNAAVSAAAQSVDRAVAALEGGMGADIAALDLEIALGALGELDGRSVTAEIVDSIFHRFCVGK